MTDIETKEKTTTFRITEELHGRQEYARGVADERARVVADLRKRARALEAFSSSRSMALLVIAQDYERGEHEREGT